MSGENDPARDDENEHEQETWQDLFGSVFGLADEVAERISDEEIEESLRRTLRDASGDAGPSRGPGETDPPEAGPQPASVAARGPAAGVTAPGAREGQPCGGTLHLSLGPRSLTLTLDRSVERSPVGPRRPIWKMPGRPHTLGPDWTRRLPGRRTGLRLSRWDVNDPPELASFTDRARPASFWAALDPVERQLFWRLAREQTYEAGDKLMVEGDRSNEVVVILDGRTMISVRDGGGQRVVAFRGPGDLVGERAALQVSVRSATVIAVESVSVLVMRTQDFAAFISAHPTVLKIIEDLIYKRLIEEPAEPGFNWDPVAMAARDLAWRPPAGRPGLDPRQLDNARCTVVATNVLAFDGPVRNAEDRDIVRAAMLDMTHSALQDVGDCLFEDRGDGMLVVVPDVVPTLTIMQHLTEALPDALRRHNRLYNVCAQIQMRIAVDTGPVEGRDRGITGVALSRVLRLLDAPVLSRTLSTSRANLGMIVSSSVYDTAIRSQPSPARYGQVWVGGKGDSQQAWMHMIDPAPERLAVRA